MPKRAEPGGAGHRVSVARNEARLTVARLARPQGRRGEVAAEVFTDFPERLVPGRTVWLWDGAGDSMPARIESVWPHKNYLVFKFAGCDTRDAARALVGREVQIPRGEAAPLPPGAFFFSDLVGCRVVEAASGEALGRVRELLETGAAPLLAVERDTGGELLIPFAQEFCRRIAPAEKLIEVVIPDGLRELNQ